MSGIYIHIPFCKQKCHYCNFYTVVSQKFRAVFIDALLKELELRKDYIDDKTINTVYFGGGTPSLLTIKEIQLIIDKIDSLFLLNENAEIRENAVERDHRPAIYSSSSRISMVGSSDGQDLAEVRGFRYGLVQKNSTAYVDRYRFENYRSAYVKSSASTLIRNEFLLLDSLEYTQIGYVSSDFKFKVHYGLYLDYSTDFWVEENTFDLENGNAKSLFLSAPYLQICFVRRTSFLVSSK